MLLSAGRRVALLRALEAAAAVHDPRIRVICADMRPELSAACQLAEQAIALPHANDPGYDAALLQACEDFSIGMIIPTIDTELLGLALLRERAAAHGTHVVIADPALIRICRDKRLTAKLFESLGIGTPPLYQPGAIVFPCFSKPYDGSSSIGAMRIEAPEQLTAELLGDPTRMFMELIPSHWREITIDLYFDRSGNLKAATPRERIETRGGEVSKGITRRDWVYDYVTARIKNIQGARGCLTLQLFADDATRLVMAIEINPRFGGGFPLALAAGANFPDWLIQEYFLGRDIAFFDGWEDGLLMLRYDDHVLSRNAHG